MKVLLEKPKEIPDPRKTSTQYSNAKTFWVRDKVLCITNPFNG